MSRNVELAKCIAGFEDGARLHDMSPPIRPCKRHLPHTGPRPVTIPPKGLADAVLHSGPYAALERAAAAPEARESSRITRLENAVSAALFCRAETAAFAFSTGQ